MLHRRLPSEIYPMMPWHGLLSVRQRTMGVMIEHVETHAPGVIIEAGTAHHAGNWGGDGQSTIIWDWMASLTLGLEIISIDMDDDGIKTAQKQTGLVNFKLGNSVEVLKALPDEQVNRCILLYLDTCWDPTGEQGFQELMAVYDRLPSGCMIAIDDRHTDEIGKHVASQTFFKSKGIEPVFSEYQIGWIKP